VEDVGDSKLMAVISAMAGHGNNAIESRHTVVFDHMQGCDRVEETKEMMKRVLKEAH
jgi:hypothetical protein